MAGSNALGRKIAGAGLAILLGIGLIGLAAGQEQPGAVETLPEATDQQPYAGQSSSYVRYNEPAPPPFDYWNPTWMPCQSLRVNRSLVLGHAYFGMDILGWATKGVHAPPLLTTSPAGTPAAQAGIIGQPGTSVVFGDEWINNEMHTGGRLTLGWWFDPNQYSAVEFQYFELDNPVRIRPASVNGPILARPFFNAGTGDNDAALVGFPGELNGSIRIASDLQLTSTGIVYRDLFWASQFARLDYLVGYRHTHLFDRLRTDESLRSLDAASGFPAGDRITRVDQFRAVNQFDGADFGLKGWWSNNGKLAFTGLAKIAIGASNNDVIINGYTITRPPTGRTSTTTNGGLLATPSNIGGRAQQQFGYVSEINGGLEWRPICNWKFSLGYTWFYWSEVARAVNQVDTTIGSGGTGTTHPVFHMHTNSFWAQGLNAGFNYQF